MWGHVLADGKQVRVGADIGGTFTDIALEVGDNLYSTKILTNYDFPEQAILDGIETVLDRAGIGIETIDVVIHGTTLATNALIERRGAKTAFMTSKGFRDVIEMRTENRFEQYDLNIVLPPPLVSREHRYVASGRLSASGYEIEPLDQAEIVNFANTVVAQGYESIAIGFLHSYVDATHEVEARNTIQRIAPDISISISAEVSPQMREFERFNTVCANAFVKPLMKSYLDRLVSRLQEIGASCQVFLIHSGGGLISVDTAAAFPVRLLESGPAGGAIYAAHIAEQHGIDRVLSYDMGGTTAKICLIENHTPKTARTFEVARTYRFKKGSGMPISIPVIEMVEIGAGGGSIAHVDSMSQIRVGPESAGSEPGPACYGRGGDLPTVTDADVMLGRIDPAGFAGGDINLDTQAAMAAIQRKIGNALGLDVTTSAVGISEMVDENMTNAARVHAVENGKDLSTFTMIAFGGAAPLHAARLCEKLGIRQLLVPPGAGVGSAIGFLRTPFAYEAVRGAYMRMSEFSADDVNLLIKQLEVEAADIIRSGMGEVEPTIERKAYMRYRGQGWEIAVNLPVRDYDEDDGETLRQLFDAEYTRVFGRSLDDLDVEVLNWSVRALIETPPALRIEPCEPGRETKVSGSRQLYDALKVKKTDAAIVRRTAMESSDCIHGPAVIVEDETTTVVTSSFSATMQNDGSLRLQHKEMSNA